MFKKILIAEDIDSISIGIVSILQNKYPDCDIRTTKYCDEALMKVKKALNDNEPFDLLITDLSFKQDYREAVLSTGEELIEAVLKIQLGIKIIVYSVDDRLYRIKNLFQKLKINGFIAKSRDSIIEFPHALNLIYNTTYTYISPAVAHLFEEKTLSEIDDYDITLLKHLSRGLTQSEISALFKSHGVNTSSTSSIEKRINRLKIYFKATNTIHLISLAKDMGVI